MKKRVFSLILIITLLLSACGTPKRKPRVDHTIFVSQDTYVLNKDGNGVDHTNTNYANDPILHLKTTNGSSYARYIYFKFDVSGLSGDDDFSSIDLCISVHNKETKNKAVAINVYGCNTNWEDKDVTFNNQPQKYSLISSRNDILDCDVEYSFPVTDYVRQNLKYGYTTVAFMLEEATPDEPKQIQIYSKEHTEGKSPNLAVSYSKKDYKKYTPGEFEFLPTGLDQIVGNVGHTKYNIVASEDVYVSGGDDELPYAATTNFGNSSMLDLKGNGSSVKYYRAILLKFDLSSYFYTTFNRVILQLDCTTSESNEGTSVNIYTCNPTSWKENSVTYNTRPSKGELITTIKSAGKGFVSVNLTDYIKQCIKNGQSTISFYLEGTESKRLKFNSTESYENAPKLILYKEEYSFTTNLTYTNVNPWGYATKLVNEWNERWATIQRKVGTTSVETITKIDAEYTNTVSASNNANGKNTIYKDYETRIMDTLLDYTYNDTESNLYDQFGGYMGGNKFKATGYFRTQYDNNGRWWLVDPLGYPFFSSGVSTVTTGTTAQKEVVLNKFRSVENWANSATKRLYELGFNSGTGATSTLLKVDQPISFTVALGILSGYGKKLGLNNSISGSTTFVGGVMPVFDPNFVEYSNNKVKSTITSYATNPNIIGWTSDNELHADSRMLDNYLNCDPTIPENVYSYATAWTFMYMMTGKTNVGLEDITNEYRSLFKAMVYDRYYKVVTDSISLYDTNHMFMGCRYLVNNFNDETLMKVSGYWCDVITVNYYYAWTPNAELIANTQRWSSTPFLVTEAYAKGMDVCTEQSGLTNESGAGWTCKTQLDRAMFYQNYTLQLLESKYCVGYNWFMYWDNDPTNTSANLSDLNANKGIYNNNHEEYTTLTSYMEQLNLNKYSLINYFDNR